KLILPAMGEGVMEATVISWLKKVGDPIAEDESVVEIATDKVDSDVPSPVAGILKEILVDVDGVAKIGEPIAILEIEGEAASDAPAAPQVETAVEAEVVKELEKPLSTTNTVIDTSNSDKFYSPLVKSIAQAENISVAELDQIQGSGLEGRVTKEDILKYVENKKTGKVAPVQAQPQTPAT